MGALKNLLGGLEHQLYCTLDLILVGLKQSGGLQQHGGVHVVSAGVHPAVLGCKLHVRLLLDGQCVHVGPQQEDLSRLFAAHQCGHSSSAAVHGLKAHIREFLFDKWERFFQIKTGLRHLMQRPSVGQNSVLFFFRFLEQCF